MSKKTKRNPKRFVNHPRYGDKPRFTNDKYTLDEIVQSHWKYTESEIILGTTIDADITKQNYSVFPIPIYVDLLKKCMQCQRKFIFYAKEQQHWYEELGFYVDADCTKCVDCRKKEQSVKQLIRQYEHLICLESRSEQEDSRLKEVALKLYQLGYIKNKAKIGKTANKAN